jgi:hypothetical protein
MTNQLNGQDAMFLHTDLPHAASHGTMIYIYDQSPLAGKTLGFREVVHHIESRLDASPVLRRKIVQVPFNLGYPFWVEDELFDIDFHVRHFPANTVKEAPGKKAVAVTKKAPARKPTRTARADH